MWIANVFIAIVKPYICWLFTMHSRVYVEFVWLESKAPHLYGGRDFEEQYKFIALTVRGKIVKRFYGVSKQELIENDS